MTTHKDGRIEQIGMQIGTDFQNSKKRVVERLSMLLLVWRCHMPSYWLVYARRLSGCCGCCNLENVGSYCWKHIDLLWPWEQECIYMSNCLNSLICVCIIEIGSLGYRTLPQGARIEWVRCKQLWQKNLSAENFHVLLCIANGLLAGMIIREEMV